VRRAAPVKRAPGRLQAVQVACGLNGRGRRGEDARLSFCKTLSQRPTYSPSSAIFKAATSASADTVMNVLHPVVALVEGTLARASLS
jgi:hypothetical protein